MEPRPEGVGEPELKRSIEKMARTRDRNLDLTFGDTNGMLCGQFGSRNQMGLADLRKVANYLGLMRETEKW